MCVREGGGRGGGGGHHLISENAVDAVVVEMDEPVKTLKLVVPHLAELDARGLYSEAMAHLQKCHKAGLKKLGTHRSLVVAAYQAAVSAFECISLMQWTFTSILYYLGPLYKWSAMSESYDVQ